MMKISTNTKQWMKAGALALMIALPSFALAAGGLSGVASKIDDVMADVKKIYVACAVGYLLYKVIQVKSGRETMMDLFWAGVWTVAAGAVTWGAGALFAMGENGQSGF